MLFLKKKVKGILCSLPSVRLSVRSSCYLLLKRWTKYNQIWRVRYLHEWGVQQHTFLGPAHLGPWGGFKGQISITKSFSKIFIPNFVCVFTNKGYKHIERDFHYVALVMPHTTTVLGVSKNFRTWSCVISN